MRLLNFNPVFNLRSLRIACLKKRAGFRAGLDSSVFFALCLFSPVSNATDIYSASAALSNGDYETAVKEFTQLAEAGDDRAQAHLGYLYYAGEGVEQSYEKAIEWYRKAATRGNRDAQYNLAVSHAFGEGTRQDLTEAAVWYRRAAEQGHIVSQYSLAISYAYGEGVPQDPREAARWFKMAAEQGYASAQVHLGSMYHIGEGVKQDYKEAARWYRMAADRGDTTAQYNLGRMYRSGRGVEQDYAQAKRWFRLSADQGYAAARNELSSLERGGAATTATRTIQTKPSLSGNDDNQAIQQLIAQPAIKQPTPGKTANITGSAAVAATQSGIASGTGGKKPLFSVDKDELLTLEPPGPDTAEEKTSPAAEHNIPADNSETISKRIVDDISETTIAKDETDALASEGTAAPKQEGFFSRIGRLFSSGDSAASVAASNPGSGAGAGEPGTVPALSASDVEPVAMPDKAGKNDVEALAPDNVDASIDATGKTTANKALTAGNTEDSTVREEVMPRGDRSPAAIQEALSPVIDVDAIEIEESVIADESVTLPLAGGNVGVAGEEPMVVAKVDKNPAMENELTRDSIAAGQQAILNKDYSEAARQFIPLAEAGNSEAQSYLGSLYYVGSGVEQDLGKSYEWYRKAAEQGNQDAQYSIGNMYLLGEGVEQSNAEAAKWYGMASEQGHTAAGYNLESLRKLEALNRQNATKQAEIEATRQAQTVTGSNLEDIETSEESIAAIENSNAEDNTPGAVPPISNSAVIENSNDEDNTGPAGEASPVDNVTDTEPAGNHSLDEGPEGKTGIAGFFGRLFSGDEETPGSEDTPVINENEQLAMAETRRPDSDEPSVVDDEIIIPDLSGIDAVNTAETDLKAQAIRGDADAQYRVGMQYYTGDNNRQDFARAALWYRRAAQQGNIDAQYSLGNMFLIGEGVNQDDNLAAYWYALAAGQGHVSASASLEKLDKSMPPVAVSTDTDTDRLTLIDNQENVVDRAASATGQGEYETGLAYALGDGVAQHDRVAFSYFLRAAKKGYALAQYKVGVAYAYGEGVSQDYRSAADWYRKAAEQGYTIAQRNLATMYLNGSGIQKDKVQALAWYQVVAANGNAMDAHRRDTLQNELSELELSQSEALAGEITSRLK